MKRYKVTLSETYEVDAENKDEAIDIALEVSVGCHMDEANPEWISSQRDAIEI